MKDKQIAHMIRRETMRQNETLDLIPSENFVSQDVLAALGSPLTNKYSEGYPGKRYYCGNEVADAAESLCRERALKVFGLSPRKWQVNVQPYSGSPANLAVILALVPPGEKIMGLELNMGGHLTHGHKVSITGKVWQPLRYGVDKETEQLDYAALKQTAAAEKPKLVIAGFTAYPPRIDFKKFREIADAAGAYLLVDMSHLAGLIAGKAYPSPFPYADVVMTTTHKTLRGPRGAMIFSKGELGKAIDKAVFPGLQGGPHMNQIAATAVALGEAMTPAFRKYASQTVKNAKALAAELKALGWRLVSGGTGSHLLLLDVAEKGLGGKDASLKLEAQGIITNMNTIPYDPRPPMDPSGIRMGTPALTTRGMKEKEMKLLAALITTALLTTRSVRTEVKALAKKFPLPY